ncbi:MAG: hypothetical protein D9V44_07470 [Actinobacteria bacterium]|nr:MAG: hypothetical protein D9V44_07470 [Actinomycetota bacterium]
MYAWSAFGPYMGAPIRQEPQLDPAATPKVALKETCRVSTARQIPLWRYHAARLRAGGCGADVISKAHEVARAAIAAYDGSLTSRVRLTLVIDADGVPTADVDRRLSSLDVMDGIVAVPVIAETDPALPSGAAKPADRSFWDAAHREARDQGADQAIITRPNGFIIDGSTASIFCRLGTVIATPPSPAAIAGVARRWILDNCSMLGYSALAAPISVDDLGVADEVFFANAFGGIREMQGRGGEACIAFSEAMRDVWERGARRR